MDGLALAVLALWLLLAMVFAAAAAMAQDVDVDRVGVVVEMIPAARNAQVGRRGWRLLLEFRDGRQPGHHVLTVDESTWRASLLGDRWLIGPDGPRRLRRK